MKKEKKLKKKKVLKKESKNAPPKTLFQLFKLLIISFIKNIPTFLKRSLIKLVIIFFIVIFINTYLLVVKNEGFAPTYGNKWLDITSLKGNVKWATAFWTFAMFFITTIFSRIKEDGIKKFLKDTFTSPSFFIKEFKSSEKDGLPTLLITLALTLLFTLLIKNKGAMLLYALIAFFSFTKRGNSFLVFFFALLKSDINRLFKKKKKIKQSNLFVMTFSVFLAFLIAFFIRKSIFIILIAILLIAISIYYRSKNKTVKTAIFVFGFLFSNYIYYKIFGRVYADDGGWQESGGTLTGWAKSEGAFTAVTLGVPAASGGALGALLGWIYSGINPSKFIPDSSIFEDMFSDNIDDILNNPNSAENIKDLASNAASTLNTDTTLDDYVDYTNIFGNFLGLDSTGNALKSGLKSLFDYTDNFSDYMKDMIKNSKTFDYVSDVFEGNSKAKLKWLKEQFKSAKSSKVDKYLNILKGGLTFVGAGLDAYDNTLQGDDATVAISKALATNSTVFLAGETSGGPTLAAWEMGNHLLFGGSKAADIGSPVKLIKGGMNWTMDALGGMDAKTIAQRMDSGYYGENIKNLYYGTDMVKDFISDPKDFYDEVGSFTRADGQGWKDMNKSVDDIFKLPKAVNKNTKDLYSTKILKTVWDHPLDSTRKLATDTGHLITKTAVKVGEGWAYIGDAAGRASVSIENSVSNSYNYLKSFFNR